MPCPNPITTAIVATTPCRSTEQVKKIMDSTTKIVMAAIGHTWVISHPAYKDKAIHQVLYTQEDETSAID